ncbi:MFS transporter [Mycobacteroides chelonae]
MPQRLSAWRFVTTFGVISMFADIVYEGARSITGPLLASLGASALVVGVVTGIGEAAALALRLVSGPLTDRTRMFWTWTIAGYALTVITVPFLGVASVLWVAATLVIAERVGKAVRSPAKDTLLSHATSVTGRGRGFAVHEAMDQVGAITGPLVVAGMLTLTHGNYLPAFAVLAVPGAAALALLFWLRRRVPHPERYEAHADTHDSPTAHQKLQLPIRFWLYAGFSGITVSGFATFGVLSFHMVDRGILAPAAVPLVYAVAMAAAAISALFSGWAYDRIGPKTLVVLPIVGAVVPMLAFTDSLMGIVLGALLWGAAIGIQESTLRAVVADLVPPARRATAYGVYAAVLGTATAVGGTLTGYLYEVSIPMLIGVVGVIQLVALVAAAPTVLRHADQV